MFMRLSIHGGQVIDPATNFNEIGTVLIEDGRIIDLLPGTPAVAVDETLDASGLLVVPGLVDLHVHCFVGETGLGLAPDQIGIEQGVTTLVDAGSAGLTNLASFQAQVAQAKTRVLAFLNLALDGLARGRRELADPANWMSGAAACAALKEQSDFLVGLKARASASCVGDQGLAPIAAAKALAAQAAVPLMVHIGNAPPQLAEVLELLTAGDIVTHAFHGKPGGIYEGSALIPAALAALERGVLFDVGHGQSSCSFATLRRYLGEGRQPDLISSDLWQGNETGPVYSLLHTMSKLLHLGLPLTEVIAATTWRAATAIGQGHQLGRIKAGYAADLSLLRLEAGRFALTDSEGETVVASQRLVPVYTIAAGRITQNKGWS